jgi:uncharacterized protein
MDIEVRNNEAHHRYEVLLDGWVVGVAQYRLIDGTVVFTHTEVDEELRGKGVSQQLVEFALDDVRASGRKVVPRCEFVRDFIADHPQYGDLLAA